MLLNRTFFFVKNGGGELGINRAVPTLQEVSALHKVSTCCSLLLRLAHSVDLVKNLGRVWPVEVLPIIYVPSYCWTKNLSTGAGFPDVTEDWLDSAVAHSS